MNTRILSRLWFALLAVALWPAMASGQGVVAGRPFASARVGWTPIHTLPFTASSSGGYYLSTHLTYAGAGAAITLAGENVTLDLNGFSLTGSGVGNGVETTPTCVTARVMGGTIRTFATGVRSATGWLEADRLVLDTCTNGIDIETGSVRRVVARNSLDGGVTVDFGLVRDSLATGNDFWGIGVEGGLVRDCVATGNNFHGVILSRAIGVRLSATSNNDTGVLASHTVLRDSTAVANDSGFVLTGRVYAADCVAHEHSSLGFALSTVDSRSVVRDCESQSGLGVFGTGYLCVRNSANSFAMTPGNLFGSIVSFSTIASSTNPHANYIH